MKNIFILALLAISFSARAQVVPVLTSTLTPGSGDFLVDKSHYPFDALVLNILAKDTGKVGLNYTMTGGTFITVKARMKYIDGRTGQPFASITRLKQFYDSFMVSPPFNTTLNDAVLNFSGDATAANQVLQTARLDSLAKFATNGGITATSLAAEDTLVIPAGSLLIGGVLTASATVITAADITGETKTEQYILAGLPTLPMQAFKASATVHTITATNGCTVFVLKLH